MEQNRLKLLLDKYKYDTLTSLEKKELSDWFHNLSFGNEDFESKLSNQNLPDVLFQDFKSKLGEIQKTSKIIKIRRLLAAASVLLIISFGLTYFILHKNSVSQVAQMQIPLLPPGSNKAILTLGNGRLINLNSSANGRLAVQGNVQINKKEDGELVYQNGKSSIEKLAYNTLATPRGGQYTLTLGDGTRVWLNAASSIKYPTSFTGKNRKVEITGEAYFEVAHNPARPFIVMSGTQSIEVLGTHFDVNSYDDEPMAKTTLLEGSIKITKAGRAALLKPGQQAQVDGNKDFRIIEHADTEGAVAWKNGMFKFNHADIKTVMRQFSRWYNVDVAYEGELSDREFSGELFRNVNASQVLDILSFSKVHFRIENNQNHKKIIVTR